MTGLTGGNVLKWWKLDICVLVSTSLGMQLPLLMYSSLFFETKSTGLMTTSFPGSFILGKKDPGNEVGLMTHFRFARFALSFFFLRFDYFYTRPSLSKFAMFCCPSHSQLDSCLSRWSLAYVPHCWGNKLNWWFWHYLFPGLCFSIVSNLFRVLQFSLYRRNAAVLTSELSNFAVLFIFVRWKHIKR